MSRTASGLMFFNFLYTTGLFVNNLPTPLFDEYCTEFMLFQLYAWASAKLCLYLFSSARARLSASASLHRSKQGQIAVRVVEALIVVTVTALAAAATPQLNATLDVDLHSCNTALPWYMLVAVALGDMIISSVCLALFVVPIYRAAHSPGLQQARGQGPDRVCRMLKRHSVLTGVAISSTSFSVVFGGLLGLFSVVLVMDCLLNNVALLLVFQPERWWAQYWYRDKFTTQLTVSHCNCPPSASPTGSESPDAISLAASSPKPEAVIRVELGRDNNHLRVVPAVHGARFSFVSDAWQQAGADKVHSHSHSSSLSPGQSTPALSTSCNLEMAALSLERRLIQFTERDGDKSRPSPVASLMSI